MISLLKIYLNEVKINNPNYKLPSHFPIKITNPEQYKAILQLLKQRGYKWQDGWYPPDASMDGSFMPYKKFPFWLSGTWRDEDEPKELNAMVRGNAWIKQQKELGNSFIPID